MTPTDRVLIAFDGAAWFVRGIRFTEHDLNRDEMVYHCDNPLGGPFQTIDQAVEHVRKLQEGDQ